MNNAFAEIEAIKFFWNKIINHGIILLDDYAYGEEFSEQKRSWDEFIKNKMIVNQKLYYKKYNKFKIKFFFQFFFGY